MKSRLSYCIILSAAFLAKTVTMTAQVNNLNHQGSGPYSTISAAISDAATVNGDTITVDAGMYAENVIVNKSLIIRGTGTTTIISPVSGIGITISADSVSLVSIRVANVPRWGIYASGRKGLILTSVVCEGDSIGAELDNITGLIVSSSSFSRNNHHGFYSSGGQNFSFTDCVFNANGKTLGDGSGLKYYNLKGSSTFTNTTVDSNKYHGMEIRSGCTNVTINGGEFKNNGSSSTPGSDGGGVYIGSYGGSAVSNVIINGPLMASNNSTAGIFADAQNGSTDSINTLIVGQSGVVTLTSNGITRGTGILLWGNIRNVNITAAFSKGTVDNSAGIIIVGKSGGASSPTNVSITNSTFNPGYRRLTPAISLADQQPSPTYYCANAVTATGNRWPVGTGVDTLIYDKLDDAALGLVTHTGDILPVEMVSFTAGISGSHVQLRWSTATEVNNYGFEVERRTVVEPISLKAHEPTQLLNYSSAQWLKIGFVSGAGTSNILQNYFYADDVMHSGRYAYRLKQIDNNGAFKYSLEMEVEIAVPKDFALHQNFPNPFNPETIISYEIPPSTLDPANSAGRSTTRKGERGGFVSLKVYDLLGREVAVLVNEEKPAGIYTVSWDAKDFPSGVYFYRLFTGESSLTRKMILTK